MYDFVNYFGLYGRNGHMAVCGIITEYNPLHLGHAYQITESKKHTASDGIILIMSGNFVQRGEPAIIDKHARTLSALETGVDLVIELPTYFATSSAEFFSSMAINLLNATGVTTHLNFGSESGQIDPLISLANILYSEPIGFKVLLNRFLKEGESFPKAREMALFHYNKNHHVFDKNTLALIKKPNNILGIEYIKALKRLDSSIIPTTLKRIGAMYHDDNSKLTIPSATAIRHHLKEGHPINALKDKLPKASYHALCTSIDSAKGPIYRASIFNNLKYKILTSTPTQLSHYQDVSEGLEFRIIKAIKHAYDYDSLIDAISTKRYTKTKIARALLHIYMGHTKDYFNLFNTHMNPYIKVLGFNTKGQYLLKSMKNLNETLPIIVNVSSGYKQLDKVQRLSFEADVNSTLLYNQLIETTYGTIMKNDYEIPVIRLNSN